MIGVFKDCRIAGVTGRELEEVVTRRGAETGDVVADPECLGVRVSIVGVLRIRATLAVECNSQERCDQCVTLTYERNSVPLDLEDNSLCLPKLKNLPRPVPNLFSEAITAVRTGWRAAEVEAPSSLEILDGLEER